jgi:hypothetical protein
MSERIVEMSKVARRKIINALCKWEALKMQ